MTVDLFHAVAESKKFWMKTPLTEKWAESKLDELVKKVDELLKKWKSGPISPFSPDLDAVVLDTMSTLRQAGVFWHNNGILVPEEEPSNWPFHLKEFERWAVVTKAERVGLSIDQAGGYVCSAGEAHEFCIRALRQSLRQAAPTAPVTLVAGASAHVGVESAAEMLGVPLVRVQCSQQGSMDLTHLDAVLGRISNRAVIVVATWRNTHGGGYDDLEAISKRVAILAQRTGLPALIHLDATRCFDEVTTLGRAERRRLNVPRIRVVYRRGEIDAGVSVGKRENVGESVGVATVTAGGVNMSGMGGEWVVALKPRQLGFSHGQFVECVAGNDDTVSGSRDALGGALVALHEARFGSAGWKQIYQQCRLVRDTVAARLAAVGVPVRVDRRGLDMVIEAGPWLPLGLFSKWGARRLADGSAMLAVQPAATMSSASELLKDFGTSLDGNRVVKRPWISAFAFAVPGAMAERLSYTAATWRSLSAHSCGYPGNHSTLSVIGPMVAHAMTAPYVPEAQTWTEMRARELLEGTCAALDVQASLVTSAFTSGSTASNRIGLLTALKRLPHATLYASAAAHYSIAKIALDHDGLRQTAVVRIPADALGRLEPSALAQALARDKRAAEAAGRPFAVVLLASAGTTFAGATDDLDALHTAAANVDCPIDHLHLDGALNLGASMARYTLGPPGLPSVESASGRYVVQGISVSLHKFPGLSVAGQVICWAPQSLPDSPPAQLVAHHGILSRRAVFELWLYRQLTSQQDSDALYQHCLANARHLRSLLQHAGVNTLFNPQSLVTLVQRQPPWLIDHFNLSPQGNWVHFVTAPHVTSAVIEEFVSTVVDHDAAVARALEPVCEYLVPLSDATVNLIQLDCLNEDLVTPIAAALYGRHTSPSTVQTEKLRVEWTNSALCFVAVDTSGSLVAAFLCRLSRLKSVESCAILLRDTIGVDHAQPLADILVHSLFLEKVVVTPKLSPQDILHVAL